MNAMKASLAAAMILGLSCVANAQSSAYTSPQECVSDVTALDVNQDHYISQAEIEGRGTIDTNVDTDGFRQKK